MPGMRPSARLVLSTLIVLAACREQSASTNVSVKLNSPSGTWTNDVTYEPDEDGSARVVINGVTFEIGSDVAHVVDLEALGLSGVDATGVIRHRSTEPLTWPILYVQSKPVLLETGALRWGEEIVGTVAAGDRVFVTKSGLAIKR